jgi:hypothetical protein
MKQIQNMNRDELINALMWVGDEDFKSSVMIGTPSNKYSDEELMKLFEFSKSATEDHLTICGDIKPTDNIVLIDKKNPNLWLRKRTRWNNFGESFSLNNAVQIMSKR